MNPGSKNIQQTSTSRHFEDAGVKAITIENLLEICWQGKKTIIIGLIASLLPSIIYVSVTQKFYESKILISPVDNNRTVDSTANNVIAQIAPNLGTAAKTQGTLVNFATLKSNVVIQNFIEQRQLVGLIKSERHQFSFNVFAKEPNNTVRELGSFFLAEMLQLNLDRETGLIELKIIATTPEKAATLANEYVKFANGYIRSQEIARQKVRGTELEKALAATNSADVRQSLGRLLDRSLQESIIARTETEFAFRIVDPAQAPTDAKYPNKLKIFSGFALAGLLAAVIILLLKNNYVLRRKD